MPFLAAKASGAYDAALGIPVTWVSFDTGTAMTAAMASGDVQISVSQGVPPFVVATSAGQDLQVVDVAVSYSENENCVVRSDLEIDAANAADLVGKKLAVPLGTGAYYSFLRQMEHFGVDVSTLDVVDMAPPESAAALSQGAIDMACGWGGSLNRMKEAGNVLLTGAERQEPGILVFDVTSAPAAFVAENPDILAKFVKVSPKHGLSQGTDEKLRIASKAAWKAMPRGPRSRPSDVQGRTSSCLIPGSIAPRRPSEGAWPKPFDWVAEDARFATFPGPRNVDPSMKVLFGMALRHRPMEAASGGIERRSPTSARCHVGRKPCGLSPIADRTGRCTC